LFWYFSGIAASEAVLQRRERRARFARAPALFSSPAGAAPSALGFPALHVGRPIGSFTDVRPVS
jgi:hypothetical protein